LLFEAIDFGLDLDDAGNSTVLTTWRPSFDSRKSSDANSSSARTAGVASIVEPELPRDGCRSERLLGDVGPFGEDRDFREEVLGVSFTPRSFRVKTVLELRVVPEGQGAPPSSPSRSCLKQSIPLPELLRGAAPRGPASR
jgi:hypothetical protein